MVRITRKFLAWRVRPNFVDFLPIFSQKSWLDELCVPDCNKFFLLNLIELKRRIFGTLSSSLTDLTVPLPPPGVNLAVFYILRNFQSAFFKLFFCEQCFFNDFLMNFLNDLLHKFKCSTYKFEVCYLFIKIRNRSNISENYKYGVTVKLFHYSRARLRGQPCKDRKLYRESTSKWF